MEQEDADMPLTLPDTQPAEALTQSQNPDSQSQTAEIWGQLVPLIRSSHADRINLTSIQLFKDSYTFGRSPNCDIQFSHENVTKQSFLTVLSKVHFQITKKIINNKNDYIIYLEDRSQNGTFVNKNIVGRGKKVVLDHDDVISLARAEIPIYKFITQVYEVNGLPVELKPKYVALKLLGSGACGEVKMVFSKENFGTYAIKVIKKGATIRGNRITADQSDRIMNEVQILQALQHPFIIKMEEIVDTPANLYIVLELMEGGELFDRIRNNSGLSERQTKFIFYQIVEAVNYLHNQGITHRDLKPENILLASDAEYTLVKVSDFGLSKLVDAQTMMKTFCGTPMYVAPEILKTGGRGAYTSQVDIWSLGVILYVTLSGCVPFSTRDRNFSLQEQILKGIYRFTPRFSTVSQKAIQLIKGMMTVEPRQRKTIRQVLLDPWLQDREVKMEIRRLLNGSDNENAPPNNRAIQTEERTAPQVAQDEDPHTFEVPMPVAKRPRIN